VQILAYSNEALSIPLNAAAQLFDATVIDPAPYITNIQSGDALAQELAVLAGQPAFVARANAAVPGRSARPRRALDRHDPFRPDSRPRRPMAGGRLEVSARSTRRMCLARSDRLLALAETCVYCDRSGLDACRPSDTRPRGLRRSHAKSKNPRPAIGDSAG
jgi:hypothetical protein